MKIKTQKILTANKYKYYFLFLSFIVCGLIVNVSSAQQNPNSKNQIFKITFKDTSIVTNDKFIIQASDSLKINNISLQRIIDYKIDYRYGLISFSKDLFQKYSLDTSRIYDMNVQYDLFPFVFKDEYSNFDLKLEKDTLTGDTVQIAVPKKDMVEDLFEGTNLEKSGSLFRGLTIGSNRDLTLNSGFRLQLNGKLSNDVEITAALTDESTPIQPEGNTTKLQELDKVYIELRSHNVTATIGDIDVNFHNSEFVNFSRKIQGAKGYGEFDFGNFLLTGAVSRGKYNSNTFNGSDGVQGPYRLTGSSNEINILVLSGTEKVYIDGIQMTRGEQADYVIDYGLGQITFTNKRLITNATRIVVEFEYSDKKYSRTFLAYGNKIDLLKKKLSIGLSYINETDNENNPIDFTLSDSDRVILRNAGNDISKAFKTGISLAGRDSLTQRGLGSYIKIDSIINFSNYTFYRFAPGDTNAIYNVTFSFVGQGKGDYISISSYQYNFVGINQGSYAPIVNIPVPTAYQLADLTLDYSLDKNKSFYLKLESAYSNLVRNKFSNIAGNNGGVALFGDIGFSKNNFELLGLTLKNIDLSYKNRVINKTFNSLDRINTVEFNRNFDVQDSTTATEDYREGNLSVSPTSLISFKGNFGQLKRGDFFNSDRYTASFEYNNPTAPLDTSVIPKIKYTYENINSSNSQFNLSDSWTKHHGFFGYRKFIGENKLINPFLQFSFEFFAENRKNVDKNPTGDSLRGESFSYDEFIPKLSLNNLYNINLTAEFDYRKDDNVNNGLFFNLSDLLIQRYGLIYNGVSWFYSTFDLAIQNRLYSDEAKQLGNTDDKTVLVNSRLRISPLRSAVMTDLLYSISSERTSIVQKVFVLVPVGQGNYIYLGDLNHNGIQDENEFELVNYDGNYIKLNIPTDNYFPTVDLKTSATIDLKPSRYFLLKGDNFISDLINNLSTETILKVDEKSKDPNTSDLYFLRFNTFLNDSNTIAGSQMMQQDVNFFENNPLYSLRLRFVQQKGFNQYSSGNERSLAIQRAFKFKLGLTKDLSTQFEYINKTDRNIAPVNSIRNRNILSNSFNSDFTYRPVQQIESGLQLNYTSATDYYPAVSNRADINQQIFRFIYSFASVGRVRVEFERDEILMNTEITNFPYELTNGRLAGKSYYLRTILDYSISKNIQASVNYDGRMEGGGQVIHTGRAQVTAFF